MGRDEPSAQTIRCLIGVKSKKRDELPDMWELVPESEIQDGDVRAAHAILAEFAKVAVHGAGETEPERSVI